MQRMATSQEGFEAESRRDQHSDGRRRPAQPLRNLRRSRPRRRARAIRGTTATDAATGKRGNPSDRALSSALRGPRLGRHGANAGRRFSSDDRRRVVGAGVRDGRDAEIANCAAIAELGITNVTSTVIATRGEHLALMRAASAPRSWARGVSRRGTRHSRDQRRGTDRRVRHFDLDDIDAAFAELEARYLAGEAAAHAQTWSLIVGPTPPLTDTNFRRRRRTG